MQGIETYLELPHFLYFKLFWKVKFQIEIINGIIERTKPSLRLVILSINPTYSICFSLCSGL